MFLKKMDELGGEEDPGMAAEEVDIIVVVVVIIINYCHLIFKGATVTAGPPVIHSLAEQTVRSIDDMTMHW